MNVHDPGERLVAAIDLVTEQAELMTDGDWERPSPCQDWNGHQVLDHVSATLRGILGMLAGRDYRASKDGDARTSSPAEAIDTWRALADEAKVAAAALDPQTELEGPMGAGPALQSLAVPTHDLTVHAWDLAATAGRSVELPTSCASTSTSSSTPPHPRSCAALVCSVRRSRRPTLPARPSSSWRSSAVVECRSHERASTVSIPR